jgi:hypothetical protein
MEQVEPKTFFFVTINVAMYKILWIWILKSLMSSIDLWWFHFRFVLCMVLVYDLAALIALGVLLS